MKKGNLAERVASKTQDAAAERKKKEKEKRQFDNYEIAIQIMKARQRKEEAFPSKDIETLVQMAIKVVA